MKSTEKPKLKTSPKIGSKIFTKKTNSNRKKSSQNQDSDKKPETSLLKKNEFALILLGALLLTIIIFFFFFRTSESNPTSVKQNISNTSLVDFEKRMQNIEKILQIKQGTKEGSKIKQNITQDYHINDRLSRLETAFSVKFDSLIDRMGEIEKNILLLKNRPAEPKSVQSKPKISIPVKKAVKKKSIFHTVQKKETLYSISKKYNTNITALRKLNKLSKNATIYPGDNIIVR